MSNPAPATRLARLKTMTSNPPCLADALAAYRDADAAYTTVSNGPLHDGGDGLYPAVSHRLAEAARGLVAALGLTDEEPDTGPPFRADPVTVPRGALAALHNFHDTWLTTLPGPPTAEQAAAGVTGTLTQEQERLLDDAADLVELWAVPIHTALGITGAEDPS